MPSQVALEAGISRQHLLRLRNGAAEPTRGVMVNLAAACTRLLRKKVEIADLFELSGGRS